MTAFKDYTNCILILDSLQIKDDKNPMWGMMRLDILKAYKANNAKGMKLALRDLTHMAKLYEIETPDVKLILKSHSAKIYELIDKIVQTGNIESEDEFRQIHNFLSDNDISNLDFVIEQLNIAISKFEDSLKM